MFTPSNTDHNKTKPQHNHNTKQQGDERKQ